MSPTSHERHAGVCTETKNLEADRVVWCVYDSLPEIHCSHCILDACEQYCLAARVSTALVAYELHTASTCHFVTSGLCDWSWLSLGKLHSGCNACVSFVMTSGPWLCVSSIPMAAYQDAIAHTCCLPQIAVIRCWQLCHIAPRVRSTGGAILSMQGKCSLHTLATK